ncbi:MAG TPA: PEGA domain-containing protein [Candidatus Angelobacter sp.]|nr:PEGA domain-containing protein [Candidatus Angelobacter sp.]
MLKRLLVVSLLFAVCLPVLAKPKKKMYGNGATDLFTAAVRTARERHVVTYVDEKMLMFTFQTGHSFFSKGFVANASVEPQDENRATLIINVQTKDGEAAFGAGDRMVDKFFDQVKEELAGQVTQKSSVKREEANVPVAPPKAVPAEPTLTAASASSTGKPALGTVILSATPEHAEVSVDGDFVGNAPVNLKLTPGKHTIAVSAKGYQGLTRDITVMPDSEVRLTANLEQ